MTSHPEAASSAAGRRQPVAVVAVALLVLVGVLSAAVTLTSASGPRTPSETSVEVGFSRDMSAHHLQAVQMANLAAGRTTDPDITRLAFDISATQTNQVGRMQGWLSLWDMPVTGGVPMQWMSTDPSPGHGGHGGMAMPAPDPGHQDAVTGRGQMPGMASAADLTQLRAATDAEFDQLFLQLMIRHHTGGTHMAAYAAEHASVPAVAELAASMVTSQTLEVATLTELLTARGGSPLPTT